MNQHRGFVSFEVAMIMIAVILLALIIGSDISAKERERDRKPTDVEILTARTYVKEFDENIKNAVDEVLICGEKTKNSIDECKVLIYDKYRVKYQNDYTIDYSDYDKYKAISKNFLSTEIK